MLLPPTMLFKWEGFFWFPSIYASLLGVPGLYTTDIVAVPLQTDTVANFIYLRF